MPNRLFSAQYREWRLKVLAVGGNKCCVCGSTKQLHCHHIRSWDLYPELRFDVSNGKVLCKAHHIDVHPFMVKYDKNKKRSRKPLRIKRTKAQKSKMQIDRRLPAAVRRESKFSCVARYSKQSYYQYGPKKMHILPK